jgi:hypothetical protein
MKSKEKEDKGGKYNNIIANWRASLAGVFK